MSGQIAAEAPNASSKAKPGGRLPTGAACPNCGAALVGAWCHDCGQSAEEFHRSFWRLTAEAAGGWFDLDSRMWRTLPRLALDPGGLTRDYLAGRRASQAPPFRMFLIVVVLLFFVGGLGVARPAAGPPASGPKVDPASEVNIDLGGRSDAEASKWLTDRVKAAARQPAAFEATMLEWAQRLAILALPLSAALLGVLFFWRRGVFMFDHLIFSMHSLSFQGILISTTMLLERLDTRFGWLLLAAPTHLFAHLKVAYGLGVFGTLARMLILFLGTLIGFGAIFAGLLLIGLYEAKP